MFNPSTSKKFKAPVGRIAQVQKIQDYSKTFHIKPTDFINGDVKRNPRYNAKKKEYGLSGIQEFPQIHQNVTQLQNGKAKKSFKENIIFEMDNQKVCKCKGKSICGGVKPSKKKKSEKPGKPKKEKQLLLRYEDHYHVN